MVSGGRAAGDDQFQRIEAELFQHRLEDQLARHEIGGRLAAAALPAGSGLAARHAHREFVRGAFYRRCIADADENPGSEFLQVARYREQHRRRDFEESARQVFHVITEMRHQLREQRQRHRDVPAQDVAQRQVGDGPMRSCRERRVVLDQVEGRGQVLAVRHQRAFRMPRGARGVDDEGRRGGIQVAREGPQRVDAAFTAQRHQLFEGLQFRVPVGEHRGGIDDHDPPQGWQPVDHRQDPVDVLLVFGDEDGGAAVDHLVFEFLHRCGRVDAIDNGAQGLRAEIGQHPFFAGIAHDRDALARREAEFAQAVRGGSDSLRVALPGPLAVQAEMLGAIGDAPGIRARAFGEQRRRGGFSKRVARHRAPQCLTRNVGASPERNARTSRSM